MTKHLERDLKSLERELLTLSAKVEGMIEKACRALRQKKPALAGEIFKEEVDIDEWEVKIEEECLKILALHQPVAVDLRRTAAVLKINNDLERIADLAVNIAERTQSLSKYPAFVVPTTLEQMGKSAASMVRRALDAFVNLDVQAAREVCSQDDEVDAYNREVIHQLYNVMRNQSELVEAALHLFSASRHIERIADHATNIAEDVIYLVEGEIARHKHDTASAP